MSSSYEERSTDSLGSFCKFLFVPIPPLRPHSKQQLREHTHTLSLTHTHSHSLSLSHSLSHSHSQITHSHLALNAKKSAASSRRPNGDTSRPKATIRAEDFAEAVFVQAASGSSSVDNIPDGGTATNIMLSRGLVELSCRIVNFICGVILPCRLCT